MILSDTRILEEIEKGTIKIVPYDRTCLGSNSYDIHLGKWLATYREHILDAKKHNEIEYFEIPEDGFVLYPHIFYLGVTDEYTETHAHVPFLEGKSSTGRLGIDIHATAGKGDVGFCGNWTLEISVKQPVGLQRHARGTIDLFPGRRRDPGQIQSEKGRQIQWPGRQAGGEHDVEEFLLDPFPPVFPPVGDQPGGHFIIGLHPLRLAVRP